MKKVIFLSLLLVFLSSGVSGGDNLVFNPSFEEEGGWRGGTRTDEVSYTGKYSLKFVSSSPSSGVYKGKRADYVTGHSLSNVVKVEGRKTYLISCWINIPQGLKETKRGAVLNLMVQKQGEEKGSAIFLKEGCLITSGWEQVEKVYTIPKGVETLRVRLGICGVGKVYFDDVEVREINADEIQKSKEVRKGKIVELPVSAEGWKTGAAEGKVEVENKMLVYHVKLNYTGGGNPKYPLGWPTLGKNFSIPINLQNYSALKFFIKAEANRKLPSPPIKVALRNKGHKGDLLWQSVDIKRGQWKEVSIPLYKVTLRNMVERVAFYIAENWYKQIGFSDGEEISFSFKDIRFVKELNTKIESLYLSQYDYPEGSKRLIAFVDISGEKRENLRVSIEKEGKKVKEEIFPFGKAITSEIAKLTKGIYKLQAEILDEAGKTTSSNYTYFRIIDRPFPYLMSITFSANRFIEMNRPEKKINLSWIEKVNETPYHGIASVILKGYEISPPPAFGELKPTIDLIKKNCKKDIWPWIFFNRFVGRKVKAKKVLMLKTTQRISQEQFSYFSKIRGMDIYDEAGALSDFYKLYRVALKVARELKSPGIVIDPEAYNNSRVYDVGYLSKELGKSEEEVINQLKKVGHRLADIAKEEFPSAILWFLFLSPDMSPTYIGEGIMERAEEKGIPLRVVEGGENTHLGYVNVTVGQLHYKMKSRGVIYSTWMKKYPHTFYLGGTISPCDTPETRKQWIKEKYAGSSIQSIEDLYPFFLDIFSTYKYVWIYAASAANFNPFGQTGEKFHKVIGKALKDSSFYQVDFTRKEEVEKVPERIIPLYSGKAPFIDGRLDDKAWSKAVKIEEFKDYKTAKPAKYNTVGLILRDRKNLYIGFRCEEPNMEEAIKSIKYKKDEKRLWRDECVEIFIDATFSREKFYQLVVNLLGYKYDREGGVGGRGKTYDSKFSAATFQEKDCWSAEISIPLSSLGEYGKVWGLNLCRERHIGGGEFSCWSPTYSGFDNPLRFGKLIFEDN